MGSCLALVYYLTYISPCLANALDDIHCEDIKHTLFECVNARETWNILDVADMNDMTLQVDRDGSVVLEELLYMPELAPLNYDSSNIKDLVLTSAWHIWWCRRYVVHGEQVFSLSHVGMSI